MAQIESAFNGGSALGASDAAGMAILVTHISVALGTLTLMVIEWAKHGKPSSVGIIGTLLVAFLAAPTFGGLGLADGMTAGGQFAVQVIGLVAVGVWTAILTYIIIKVVGLLVGLRVSEEVEIEGLDIRGHGERGYEL